MPSHRRFRYPVDAFVYALLIGLIGCSRTPSGHEVPPDDEAMLWARVDGKNAEEAAQDYFYPRKIVDYFEGMDTLSLSPDPKADFPDQLLDHKLAAAAKAEKADGQLIPAKEQDKSKQQVKVGPLSKEGTPNVASVRPKRDVAPAKLNESEAFGRNAWLIWCGGNERFWDWLAIRSLGFTDLLKVVDGRTRTTRFHDAGLINEPQMQQAGSPSEFGLWLDVPADDAIRTWRENYLRATFDQLVTVTHPVQRHRKDFKGPGPYLPYPENVPPPSIYGLSSGVIGLRLFPNPEFDAAAAKRWDVKRYYNDESYFADPKLVRPFRVGMSCGFCHVSYHPLKPPRDLVNPGWENISGNIGAQYLRIRAVFGNLLRKDNFIYHILDSQPPGTIDTSLIPSDNINNTNAMNSVFNLSQRVVLSFKNPMERLSSISAKQPNAWGNPKEILTQKEAEKHQRERDHDKVPKALWDAFENYGLLNELKDSNAVSRCVPRILFDGADSIGSWGALARVFLNIGLYSEQWEKIHNPVVGFEDQKAFRITDCENHSVYWHATQHRVNALRDYFLKASTPMRLLDTPDGLKRAAPIDEVKLKERAILEKADFLTLKRAEVAKRVDLSKLALGRRVFARNCIVCHSSIQPEGPESGPKVLFAESAPEGYEATRKKVGDKRKMKFQEWADAKELWDHDPGQWLRDPDYLKWAETVVEQARFWTNNYLSTDYRIPVNVVGTNSARAMATNAMRTRMWSDFSSESYQEMNSIGPIRYYDPYAKEWKSYTPRHKAPSGVAEGGGGPGFYRVPTLISIWTTAPLLHNNSLGNFTNDPSVDGRLIAFDDAMRKMLWPDRRFEGSTDRGAPVNDATTERLKGDNGLIWRTPQETHLVLQGRFVPQTLFGRFALYKQLFEWFPWLDQVTPPWLASVLLFGSAFLLLLVGCAKHRLWLGIAFLACGLLAAALLYYDFTSVGWVSWLYVLQALNPPYLAAGILVLAGITFISLYTPVVSRAFGILYMLLGGLGLLITALLGLDVSCHDYLIFATFAAGVVLFLLGQTRAPKAVVYHWLGVGLGVLGIVLVLLRLSWEHVASFDFKIPLWIPSLLLLMLGFVLRFFFAADHGKLIRFAAYSKLVLAILIGGVIYFLNGRIGEVRLGPIPEGTPVNLLANINPEADPGERRRAIATLLQTFAEIKSKNLKGEAAQKEIRERVAPALLSISKCPDFVMDQGHFFPWFRGMSDEEKDALIELLKTF